MSAIKLIREKMKLSQAEFAALAGVTQATVSRWDDGMQPRLPALDRIRRAARARGLPWDDSWFFEVAQ